jgi:hypothetical protein
MDTATAHEIRPASNAEAPAAVPVESPIGRGEKLVVISFLLSVGLFGLISLVDLFGNLFRD